MIDSHLHLDDEKLCERAEEIVSAFSSQNILFAINNSCDYNSMLAGVALAEKYDRVYATVGMHPHTSSQFDDTFIKKMYELGTHPKVVAVGEIGLDYYYNLSPKQTQKDVFAEQLEIADKLGLPVTLHIRDAYGDALDILTAQKKYLNHGVLWHCYSGSAEFARQMAKQGHYFAFGGAITFKNANKQDVIDAVPFDKVLTETDSPYMSPVPLRGTVNEPKNVAFVLQKLAELYHKPVEEVEQQVCQNTLALFTKISDTAK